MLGRTGKTSRRKAEAIAHRAATLSDAPAIAEGLAEGALCADHADAFASRTPEQFRRHLNQRARLLADDDGVERSEQQRSEAPIRVEVDESSGMGEVRGELHPDDYQKVKRRLDAEVALLKRDERYRQLRRDQLQAVALVNLIPSNKTASRVPAVVAIHVGLDAINDVPGSPRFGEYIDGSPVPVEAIRRHACDANILPVVLNSEGMPLDVGRAQRLATNDQRHALRSMYRTCAATATPPSIAARSTTASSGTNHQGPTDLKYLYPVCVHHHHRLHEGRWQAQLDESTRRLTVTYPDGTLHSRSRPDLLADLASAPDPVEDAIAHSTSASVAG